MTIAGDSQTARIRWDLSLRPRALEDAFWREHTSKYTRWDTQVSLFFTVLLVPLTLHRASDLGWRHALSLFGPAWLNQVVWRLALRQPSFYTKHRLPLLTLAKALLAYQTLYATNKVGDNLYVDSGFTQRSPAAAYMLKMVLMCNVPYLPAWVAGAPQPMLHQFFVTLLTVVVLLLGACTRDFITYSNIQEHVERLESTNAFWTQLVQSGTARTIHADTSLHNRTVSVVMALVTTYLTLGAATVYLAYMIQWRELRRWLKEKACCGSPPAEAAADAAVNINGVLLAPRQLLELRQSPAASLLLDGRGLLGRLSMVLLHASILNGMCLASLLLSQVLVLRLAPQVVPASVLSIYFPTHPDVEQGVCSPDAAPQFTGWMGRLLLVLGA